MQLRITHHAEPEVNSHTIMRWNIRIRTLIEAVELADVAARRTEQLKVEEEERTRLY
jgi:hypothetical protein